MLDSPDSRETTATATAEAPARRRVFRSKADDLRTTYGFEDVSLAPGTRTVEPSEVELSQIFWGLDLGIPILAAAMDAVVDARFSGALASLGGLAVLNLEGVQTRYEDADAVLARIAAAPDDGGSTRSTGPARRPPSRRRRQRRVDSARSAPSTARISSWSRAR